MIEGVLRHDTEMQVKRQYVDSHGQSEVAFAFCRLLGFALLPRLKAISSQRLYLPTPKAGEAYANLTAVLTRPIDWELIQTQYDEMVRYATALWPWLSTYWRSTAMAVSWWSTPSIIAATSDEEHRFSWE